MRQELKNLLSNAVGQKPSSVAIDIGAALDLTFRLMLMTACRSQNAYIFWQLCKYSVRSGKSRKASGSLLNVSSISLETPTHLHIPRNAYAPSSEFETKRLTPAHQYPVLCSLSVMHSMHSGNSSLQMHYQTR